MNHIGLFGSLVITTLVPMLKARRRHRLDIDKLSTSRQNPRMNSPAKKGAGRPGKPQAETQVIGFRLDRALAHEVKTEAARRGTKLNDLFAELWEQYKRQSKT